MHADHIKGAALALLAALQLKSPETHSHSRRVASLAALVATKIKISNDERIALSYGSLLHDVGKLNTADQILNKSSKLNPFERAAMKDHAEQGGYLLKSLGFPSAITRIVSQHHERYDGTGYPSRRSARSIDRGARIVSVCDAFDAITSDRCYSDARPVAEAIDEILKGSGKQFDCEIVLALSLLDLERWHREAHK